MRKTFLQGEALFVEVVARAPKLEGNLPGAALTAGNDRRDLIKSLRVVSDKCCNPAWGIGERSPVSGQNQTGLIARQPPQTIQVLVQWIRGALRVEADVG